MDLVASSTRTQPWGPAHPNPPPDARACSRWTHSLLILLKFQSRRGVTGQEQQCPGLSS